MIGHATLLTPSATTSPAMPQTAQHEAHSAARADAMHESGRATHEDGDTPRRADRTSAHAEHPAHAHAAGRSARATRRGHEDAKEGDETPARDAFARLLDQAPAPVETKPALPTPTTTSTQDAGPPTTDTKPASLPDQLLGLLASLAPGAQATQATTATTPAAPTDAQSPAAPLIASPQGKPATPAVGADAATALPALQDASGATVSNAATITASIAAAVHGEDTTSALPSLHDSQRQDNTPAPTPFDALVRATAPTATDVPRPVVPATPMPVAQPTDPRAGYGDELGSSVVWMADQRISHAEVRVVPDHLGPIDVRLQLDGAQVHATFLSAQPEVRHALEASLPRLRDLLGQHGLQLAQADVGQRQQDPRATRGGSQAATDNRDAGDDTIASMASETRTRVVRGLLDEYA
jgi:flagellar hook-length control protein FliK